MTAAVRAMGTRRAWLAPLALGLVIVATSLMRILIGGDRPLWFDEVWTAVVVGQPGWPAFARLCLNELSPPFYYLVVRLFTLVGGLSNEALRLPSLLAGLATPLLALLPVRSIDRPTRLLWSLALACWTPGLWLSHDARCYTLLLLLATGNLILYLQLLRAPATAAAARWAASGTLLMLTHYYAGPLLLCQGVLLLVVHRQRALRCWPALLAFAPAVAWLALHLPRLAEFSRLSGAAYGRIGPGDWPWYLGFALGGPPIIVPMLVLVGILLLRRDRFAPLAPDAVGDGAGGGAGNRDHALILACAASIAALVLVLGIATLVPVLNPRYLIPFVPGLLLGAAYLVRRGALAWRPAPHVFIASYFAVLAIWVAGPDQGETSYNFQTASSHLMRSEATRLVFLWDHPLLMAQVPADLRQVGGFFFKRAGRPVPVDTLILPPAADPNPELLRRAAPAGSAILWMYTTDMPGIRAMRHPPVLARSGWQCRDFGESVIVVLACTRPAAPPVATTGAAR